MGQIRNDFTSVLRILKQSSKWITGKKCICRISFVSGGLKVLLIILFCYCLIGSYEGNLKTLNIRRKSKKYTGVLRTLN